MSPTKNLYGRKWQAAARQHVIANPYCAWCGVQAWMGDTERRPPVDHIVPHNGDTELFWGESNWQTMCEDCHGKKTRAEQWALTPTWHVVPGRFIVCGQPGSGRREWIRNRKGQYVVWDEREAAHDAGYAEVPTARQRLQLTDKRQRTIQDAIEWGMSLFVIIDGKTEARALARLINAVIVPVMAQKVEV